MRELLREDPNQSAPAAVEFLAHPLWKGAFISFAAGFIIGGICFLAWRLLVRLLNNRGEEGISSSKPTLFSSLIKDVEDLKFLEKLEDHEKQDFEIIGQGGCGTVYMAKFVTGGRLLSIAIKKIVQSAVDKEQLCEDEIKRRTHRMRQVWSEIVTVGRVRHPNLLQLLAHVPLPRSHLLVYEYMKNGCLQRAVEAAAAGTQPLSWPARHKIALGVATGLEYLHIMHRPRIIHRDLKPANILLTNSLEAIISDFGLAKIVPDGESRPLMSSKVAGTLGYIAPEYYQTLEYSDKSDIYSFGVILAVLITGRFPNDRFFYTTEEMSIIQWIRSALNSENPGAVIDENLLGSGFENEMLLVLKIACFCTYDDPRERPNGRDIRCMLSQIKH